MFPFIYQVSFYIKVSTLSTRPSVYNKFVHRITFINHFLFVFRLNEGEKLNEKLLTVCEKLITELIIVKSSKQLISSVAMKRPTYDIFVSYPTKHGDKMKVVYEILCRHNPNLNIFYDKLELQTGEKNNKKQIHPLSLSFSPLSISAS